MAPGTGILLEQQEAQGTQQTGQEEMLEAERSLAQRQGQDLGPHCVQGRREGPGQGWEQGETVRPHLRGRAHCTGTGAGWPGEGGHGQQPAAGKTGRGTGPWLGKCP